MTENNCKQKCLGFVSRIYEKLSRHDKHELDKRSEQTFYQRRYINSSKTHEKMLHPLATWRDAKQAYKWPCEVTGIEVLAIVAIAA